MEDIRDELARIVCAALRDILDENPNVEQCREHARSAGYEMMVRLQADIGFRDRVVQTRALARYNPPGPVHSQEITADDVPFMNWLRIADAVREEETGPCGAD